MDAISYAAFWILIVGQNISYDREYPEHTERNQAPDCNVFDVGEEQNDGFIEGFDVRDLGEVGEGLLLDTAAALTD